MAVLLLACLASPSSLFSGNYLDARLPLLMGFAFIAFSSVHGMTLRQERMLACGVALVMSIRLVVVGNVWLHARPDLAEFRALGGNIPPNSRLLELTAADDGRACRGTEHPEREVYHFGSTAQSLAGFWVIERKMFWPLLFADPSQQPVRVVPPYDRLAVTSKSLTLEDKVLAASPVPPEAVREAPYLVDWPSNFDFVLVVSVRCAHRPGMFAALPLRLAGQADIATLYRVDGPAGGGTPLGILQPPVSQTQPGRLSSGDAR
jgi:hypothetical protein